MRVYFSHAGVPIHAILLHSHEHTYISIHRETQASMFVQKMDNRWTNSLTWPRIHTRCLHNRMRIMNKYLQFVYSRIRLLRHKYTNRITCLKTKKNITKAKTSVRCRKIWNKSCSVKLSMIVNFYFFYCHFQRWINHSSTESCFLEFLSIFHLTKPPPGASSLRSQHSVGNALDVFFSLSEV